jgi:predicted nucleic acid-binding protein
MEPVLVDTSVWIDWFRDDKTSLGVSILATLLERNITVYCTAVILQEVLQGVRYDQLYEQVKDTLLSIPMLRLDPVEAALGAADLYRNLRKNGVTIRKRLFDCPLCGLLRLAHPA